MDQLVPLYGFVTGDSLGLLVLARSQETIAAVGEKLQRSASVRVAPRACCRLLHGDRELDPTLTVEECGLEALDRIDLVMT